MMLQIGQNIKLIRGLAGKTQPEFAILISENLSNLKTYETKDVMPKLHIQHRIAKIGGVTVDQLINDELTPDDITINLEVDKVEKVARETYLEKRRDHKNNGTKKDVPVFGGFTTLGNIQVYDDGNVKNKIVGHLPADFFPNCDYAERAKGDSMYPLIMNQALLIGKTCSIRGITFGEKYIIKTKDGMDTTKFVHPGSEVGFVKLKAYNKSIPDQEIDIKEVVFVCRVHWIVNPT